jgi:hypothetical protein
MLNFWTVIVKKNQSNWFLNLPICIQRDFYVDFLKVCFFPFIVRVSCILCKSAARQRPVNNAVPSRVAAHRGGCVVVQGGPGIEPGTAALQPGVPSYLGRRRGSGRRQQQAGSGRWAGWPQVPMVPGRTGCCSSMWSPGAARRSRCNSWYQILDRISHEITGKMTVMGLLFRILSS